MLTVYSKPNCPACEKAKQLLKTNNIDFEVVDISTNEKAKSFVLTQGHRSVPQIYQDGKLFVENGYVGLSSLSKEELLNKISVEAA